MPKTGRRSFCSHCSWSVRPSLIFFHYFMNCHFMQKNVTCVIIILISSVQINNPDMCFTLTSSELVVSVCIFSCSYVTTNHNCTLQMRCSMTANNQAYTAWKHFLRELTRKLIEKDRWELKNFSENIFLQLQVSKNPFLSRR